ncbi:NTP transferase domain-containing protein [Candidatus Bathyarchaeota archaeon]|nr:NTP transferase domain-containing protein [Candidatus Bathyarchaeota archaeon]
MRLPALIMAGGKGKRFHTEVEKPLAPFLGKPLIEWVINAVKASSKIPVFYIVTSPHTPKTEEKCLRDGLNIIRTAGENYHRDLQQAIIQKKLYQPVLILSSDLPALTGTFLDYVISRYEQCGKPALTVLVPMEKCREIGILTASADTYGGTAYAVSGVNIIDGSKIFQEDMDQEVIIYDGVEAALNINSLEDLRNAEKYFKRLKLSR